MIGEKAGISVGAIFGIILIVIIVISILFFGQRLAASNLSHNKYIATMMIIVLIKVLEKEKCFQNIR